MKNIKEYVRRDGSNWLELALACKKAKEAALHDLSDLFSDRYDSYFDIVRNNRVELPESLFSDDDKRHKKDVFIDLYNHPPAKLKNFLIKKRRGHSLTSCPYCGNPTIPDTLDHFIPKNLFAEYAIFPNNLVPQCRGCAPVKSNKYYSAENEVVMFSHPFDSSLLNKIFVDVISNVVDGNIIFDVVFSTSAESDEDKLAISLHIKSLNIKERILTYCYKEIKKWMRKLSQRSFDIEAVLTARLTEHDISDKRSNWEFVLYKSILESELVISLLKSIHPEIQSVHTDVEIRTVLDV